MNDLPAIQERATGVPSAEAIDTKLEVIIVPVADPDRSKLYYEQLGWRLDADFVFRDDFRVLQLTPPGSACSIMFGRGVTPAPPGSAQGLMLVVSDIEQARADLIRCGADVSEIFHFDVGLHVNGTKGRLPGPDPQRRSYFTFASFRDPDGNAWLLQEVTTRFPGRGFGSEVANLTDVLREAEEHHGAYEATAPKHHWSDWYAAYVAARQRGTEADEAARLAARHLKSVLR